MSLTKITSAKKIGFGKKALRVRREQSRQTLLYLRQKSSFLIAAVSLVAFLAGNMVGQHGWYAFMKAALGKQDDSLITYTGTVPPIGYVPDYKEWATYGGDSAQHTYREVPQDLLLPLPAYQNDPSAHGMNAVYSVDYMGNYVTGKEGAGSHPGVDIRVPQGTPVRSIANGVVVSVRDDSNGFGKLIVIRHPHMPDPAQPSVETVLFSDYAHLSAQLVTEGDTVQKGQLIGLSGMSGDATGPHLHFQIDRSAAPWHPYWPFTGADLRQAGLSASKALDTGFHQDLGYKFTINPVLYTQQNLGGVTVVSTSGASSAAAQASSSSKAARLTVAQAAAVRRSQRLAQAATHAAAVAAVPLVSVPANVVATVSPETHTLTQPAPTLVQPSPRRQNLASVSITSARTFSTRAWMTLRITLLDAQGNTMTDKNALKDSIVLRTAYGEAEFNPEILTAADFNAQGSATVQMLPRGRRTIVPMVEPFGVLGTPIQFSGE